MTLSVMVRDQRGIEMIHGGVRSVMMTPERITPRAGDPVAVNPGISVLFYNGTDIFVEWPKCSSSDDIQGAGVYVMNDEGKTVGKYRF